MPTNEENEQYDPFENHPDRKEQIRINKLSKEDKLAFKEQNKIAQNIARAVKILREKKIGKKEKKEKKRKKG